MITKVNIYKSSIAIIFMGLLLFPLTQQIFGLVDYEVIEENRELAKYPEFTWKIFFKGIFLKDFDTYYKDNFGFRSLLIKYDSYINYNLFKKSINDRVTIGKNGWFYLTETIHDYEGETLSPQEIELIADNLGDIADELKLRGKKFLFFVAPNKNTIYPEYMPEETEFRKYGKKNNLDMLYEKLESDGRVNYLDLRPILFEYKEKYLVYPKDDSHWSSVGSFVASQEILKKMNLLLGEEFIPTKIDFQEYSAFDKRSIGSTSKLLGLSNVTPYIPPKAQFPSPRSNNFRVIWNHDSFTERIKYFLNPYCGYISYGSVNKGVTLSKLLRDSINDVDIVVLEKVERGIKGLKNTKFPSNL